jgi:Cys-tRNA(Pro) deacylase
VEALARFQAERVPGKGRGKQLGFPTVNLRVPENLQLPHGIYACWVRMAGDVYPAALHYGPVPAFGEEEPSLEVHVLDQLLEFTPDRVEVEVVRWIRPVQAFDSPDQLRDQIRRDLEACREALGQEADPLTGPARELQRRGIPFELRRFARSTRTAQEAAEAVGASPDRIVKSLLFLADGEPVLVLVSGAHRVSKEKLARVTGASRVRPADAETVARVTGFPAGSVPPVGHATPVRTFMDQALLGPDLVYAGAGDPQALFVLHPEDLRRATGATVVDLRED